MNEVVRRVGGWLFAKAAPGSSFAFAAPVADAYPDRQSRLRQRANRCTIRDWTEDLSGDHPLRCPRAGRLFLARRICPLAWLFGAVSQLCWLDPRRRICRAWLPDSLVKRRVTTRYSVTGLYQCRRRQRATRG